MLHPSNNYISIRSTIISGFPGENTDQHNKLIDFLKEYKLDNVGFFAYSKEEGTKAATMPNQIHGNTKSKRVRELKITQHAVMIEKQRERIGRKVEILVDGIDYDKQMFFGHSEYDAPDVDKKVYFTSDELVRVGEYETVTIKDIDTPDYIAVK